MDGNRGGTVTLVVSSVAAMERPAAKTGRPGARWLAGSFPLWGLSVPAGWLWGRISRWLLLVPVCLLAGCTTITEAPQFGQEVTPPNGWLDCQRAGRAECQSRLLDEVLERGRSQHIYISDNQQYGKAEDWRAELIGDCDGFALWCREELRQHGIDALLAFVRVPQGAGTVGHLVCMTPDGHVLDNRHPRVASWQNPEYEWVSAGPFPGGVWRMFGQR